MPISRTKGALLAFLGVSSCAVLFRGDAGSYDVAPPVQKVCRQEQDKDQARVPDRATCRRFNV